MTPASPERLRERRRRKELLAQIAQNEEAVAEMDEKYKKQMATLYGHPDPTYEAYRLGKIPTFQARRE
jgi:hypothetical protein